MFLRLRNRKLVRPSSHRVRNSPKFRITIKKQEICSPNSIFLQLGMRPILVDGTIIMQTRSFNTQQRRLSYTLGTFRRRKIRAICLREVSQISLTAKTSRAEISRKMILSSSTLDSRFQVGNIIWSSTP